METLNFLKTHGNSDSAVEMATKFLGTVITDEDVIADLRALTLHFGIDPLTEYNNADAANLRACRASEIDCVNCNNQERPNCFKYTPYLQNNHIQVTKQICNVNRVNRLIDNSGIPQKFRDFRAGLFKVNAGNVNAVNMAGKCINGECGLFINGKVGSGKSLLASVIVIERAYLGKVSKFFTVTDLLDNVNVYTSQNVEDRAYYFHLYKTVNCLVIDDLGAESVNDWVSSTLFSIIDARYKANLCTVFTSNFDVDSLANLYGNMNGDRIRRRIKELCTTVTVN